LISVLPIREGVLEKPTTRRPPAMRRKAAMKRFVIAIGALAIPAGAALAQDMGAGEISFRKCQPCHDVGPEARNKIGPKLNGLEGAKRARSRVE
jgi:cytochrome c2